MGSNPSFSDIVKFYNSQAFDIKLILTSNNKKSIHVFLNLFKKLYFLIFAKKLRIVPVKSKKYQLSILKSPHINKIAQDQYHSNKITYKLNITEMYTVHLLLFLKLIKTIGMSDINMKCKFFIYSQKRSATMLKKIDVDPDKSLRPFLKPSVEKYLELFDLYGEILNKK